MANKYIVLNGKRYRTTGRSVTPQRKKARQVNVTVGGQTAIQTFGFTDYRWKVDILTAIQVSDPQYGTLTDLETAYDLAYVSYTDVFGQVHNVVPEGDLITPPDIGILDDLAPFKVTLNLRKRQ